MSVNRLALGDRLQTIERSIACTYRPGTHSGLLCFTTSSLYHSYASVHLYFLPFLLSAILFSTLITSISFVFCPCTCDHLYPPMFYHYVDIFLPLVILDVQNFIFVAAIAQSV